MLRLRYLLRRPHARSSLFSPTHPRSDFSKPQNVRHVRFRRPWIRSFISKCLLYGTAFHLWSTFVLIRFDDDIDDADLPPVTNPEGIAPRQTSLESGKITGKEVENEGALFIPLGWSRLQQGELYTTSDPEWQEFAKLSKDRKKLEKLRDELATIVLDNAGRQMSRILGEPLSLTGFWLVHQFPNRAPPGYVRSGVEVKNDSISWVSKPMDPEIGDRLQTFMKPVHVALAIRDAYLVLLLRQLDRFRKLAGDPLNAFDLLNDFSAAPGDERGNWIGQKDQSKLQPPLSDGLKENMPPNTENSNYHPSSFISLLQRLPLPDLGQGSDLHLASQAFKLRLNHERAQRPGSARRGAFFITGPVGLKGLNGFCRFEVKGEYDPAKREWRTVEMTLKDLNMRRQKALGG
ncbi:unnamed protein product [Penicillium nalgiovense]|uniref:Uncharacterized protein n=1 Tax=Penicillium nalgiovense TaxID=60175 RepID=A0A9W4HS19_PENNA|nr:unnamed protein product [Penicillium nalgiovense]CAG7996086.1 unnamed protein product [Penicillium nalgiovense]CAG8001987.1 unnamed protein product [Penicillium nalgiovense]CAG8004058.1 unnamed protein product [Penicillium nalgiovense]CAG8011754.1 unnamed protein product [Penicillium nalgiovense]